MKPNAKWRLAAGVLVVSCDLWLGLLADPEFLTVDKMPRMASRHMVRGQMGTYRGWPVVLDGADEAEEKRRQAAVKFEMERLRFLPAAVPQAEQVP
jgi:hypothetical protein